MKGEVFAPLIQPQLLPKGETLTNIETRVLAVFGELSAAAGQPVGVKALTMALNVSTAGQEFLSSNAVRRARTSGLKKLGFKAGF